MGEELQEILKNRSNEEYIENICSEESNVEIDEEGDRTEESAFRGKAMAQKNRKLPLLQVESIRLFHISLE